MCTAEHCSLARGRAIPRQLRSARGAILSRGIAVSSELETSWQGPAGWWKKPAGRGCTCRPRLTEAVPAWPWRALLAGAWQEEGSGGVLCSAHVARGDCIQKHRARPRPEAHRPVGPGACWRQYNPATGGHGLVYAQFEALLSCLVQGVGRGGEAEGEVASWVPT